MFDMKMAYIKGSLHHNSHIEFSTWEFAFGNHNFVANASGGSGLFGDQCLVDHFTGNLFRFFWWENEPYTAFESILECTFTTATSQYLSFQHQIFTFQIRGNFLCFLSWGCYTKSKM